MSKEVFQLTESGKAALEKERAELIDTRGEVSERIAEARSFGDLSENSEYSAARDLQARSEERIKEITHILSNAKIIAADKTGRISLGELVELETDGKLIEYRVVGGIEADPLNGKISGESTLGAALIDKKMGDEVTIETPKGQKTYKITKISE